MKCSDSLQYCDECSSTSTCTKCQSKVANLDTDNKCTLCNGDFGWVKNANTGSCECPNYIYANNGNTCSTCEQLMPGCAKCEYAESAGEGMSIKIGFDSTLSTQSK